jgi:hypothetical protein
MDDIAEYDNDVRLSTKLFCSVFFNLRVTQSSKILTCLNDAGCYRNA